MATKRWVVKDLEDGSRSIGDCLKLGFQPNERVLSNLPGNIELLHFELVAWPVQSNEGRSLQNPLTGLDDS